MTFAAVRKLIKTVDGWLSPIESEALYNLAKACQGNGVIVEIGSWKGKSTICLGHGSKAGRGVKIYAVDPHTGSPENIKALGKVWTFDQFEANIKRAKVADIVTPIVKTSAAAVKAFKQPIEFIFIDGAHEYEAVREDFDLWFPKVLSHGTMAFHDTTQPGPQRLVEEAVYTSKHFRHIRMADSITIAEKVNQATLGEQFANRTQLVIRKGRQLAGVIVLSLTRSKLKTTGQ